MKRSWGFSSTSRSSAGLAGISTYYLVRRISVPAGYGRFFSRYERPAHDFRTHGLLDRAVEFIHYSARLENAVASKEPDSERRRGQYYLFH